MDARTVLQRLLAPLGVGDELAGYRVVELTEAHGMRVVLARDERRVFLDVDARDPGFPSAAETARLAISYRSGAPQRPLASGEGRRLALALAAHLAPREDEVLEALAREAAAVATRDEGTARIRDVVVTQALEPAGEGSERFETISPYVGCLVGCTFCYAQERLHRTRALLGLPPVPWGSWVDVRANLPEVLEAELASAREALPIKLCPIVSDPYHAIERRLRLTRRVLEVLAADGRRRVFVLTRSAIVRDDLPLLAAMRAALGISLSTVREEVRAAIEPRSARIDERLAVLAEAAERGVETFAIVQPVLDEDVEPLADAVARVTRSAQVDVLRGTYGAAAAFEGGALRAVADERTQRALASRLTEALASRGVVVWGSELPPA